MKLNSIPIVWLVELNIYTISVHSTFPLNTMRMNKSGRYLDIIRKQTKSNFNTIDWKAQCQDCIPGFVLSFSFKMKIKELYCSILTLQITPGRYFIINAIQRLIVLIKTNGTLSNCIIIYTQAWTNSLLISRDTSTAVLIFFFPVRNYFLVLQNFVLWLAALKAV